MNTAIEPRDSLPKGLNRDRVIQISENKHEPGWMTDFRLRALDLFYAKPMPAWGPDLGKLHIDDICYYLNPTDQNYTSWDEVPRDIKDTFTKLGIPQAEQQFLAGVGAQFESEVIYKSLRAEWRDQGVIFSSMEAGVRDYPEIVRTYFGTIIPAHDNKFAALNSAVWSGGSFVYIPAGVTVTMPLQAYFRINAREMGQFERTLIITEPGASVHYIEGCSAPAYRTSSLHSAVVEVIAQENSTVRYTTIQNWSKNVYNLVTKRALAEKNAKVVWVDGNFGSAVTMKYPAIILNGPHAHGEIMSLAVAHTGQHHDSGGKLIARAPHTTGTVIAKSVSTGSGRSSYRGLVKTTSRVTDCRVKVSCEALLVGPEARSDTYPTITTHAPGNTLEHEASISRIGDDQLWYLALRGIGPQQALGLMVNGFIGSLVEKVPMEYAIEINRLIDLELEGAIG